MNKNIALIGGLIIIGSLGLMSWGRSMQNEPAQTNPENDKGGEVSLTVSKTKHDFGTISMADGNKDTLFTVNNPTNEDIMLSSVVTSCMCTNAYIENDGQVKGPFGMPGHGPTLKADELIRAGESRNIKVVYDPNAHGPAGVGPVDRFIELTEAGGGKIQLEIVAIVTP